MNRIDLANRVVIVTGGARGIGAASAKALAESLLARETGLSPAGRGQLEVIQRAIGDVAGGPMRGAQSAYPFNRSYMYR